MNDEQWRKWAADVEVAVDDLAAVAEDQLRPVRERDLGVREATRLVDDAREKLAKLFAHVERGRDPEAP